HRGRRARADRSDRPANRQRRRGHGGRGSRSLPNRTDGLMVQQAETGLLLPSREVLLWADSDLSFVVGAARRAERAGYDSVWVGDSLLARPRGEPLTLLAALVGRQRASDAPAGWRSFRRLAPLQPNPGRLCVGSARRPPGG